MKLHRKRIRGATAAIAAVGALVVIMALVVMPALATPPVGVTTQIFGVGRFTDIDAKTKTDVDPGNRIQNWTGSGRRERRTSTSCRTRSPPAGRSAGIAIPGPVS